MKAISGVLVLDPGSRRNGDVRIEFTSAYPEGVDLGHASLSQYRIVGGIGRFNAPPAYMAHFREYTLEDSRRGRGRRERDEYIINSECTATTLSISWEVGDDADVFEIGFLVVGEEVQLI